MNILFVDQFGELGGAQQCLLELIPATLQRGWQAFAAVPGDGPLAERLKTAGARVTRIQTPAYTRGKKRPGDLLRFGLETPRLAWQLRRICERNNIGLLYVNGPRMLPAAALAPFAVPLLLHAHSVPAGRALNLVRWAVSRRGIRVVAVSHFVAASMRGCGDVTVVPNGVKDLRLPRRANSVPRAGVLGRIAPEKGQLLFVEASRHMTACQLVICGAPTDPSDEYYLQLREKAAGLPIEFLGWRDDIATVLGGLDVLVVPSTADEGFCRAVIEGFSAMVPVVAFPSGGIPELIEDRRTGYLVNTRTSHALADRVMEVLRDTTGRERVTDAARALWESKYTVDQYTDNIMEQMALAARCKRGTPRAW